MDDVHAVEHIEELAQTRLCGDPFVDSDDGAGSAAPLAEGNYVRFDTCDAAESSPGDRHTELAHRLVRERPGYELARGVVGQKRLATKL